MPKNKKVLAARANGRTLLDAPVSLESILCTEELNRRPSRPPDYETENRALVALAQALADSPRTVLQTLADAILQLLQSDSAGQVGLSDSGSTSSRVTKLIIVRLSK
jgi:hypothetical protein